MIVVAKSEIEVTGYGWLVDGKPTSTLVPGENVLPDDIERALRRKLEIYAENGFIEIRSGDEESVGCVELREEAADPSMVSITADKPAPRRRRQR